MKIRIITAAITIPLFLFIIYLAGIYLKILLLIFSLLALFELFKIIKPQINYFLKVITFISAAIIIFFNTEQIYLLILCLLFFIMVFEVNKENIVFSAAIITFMIIYSTIGFFYFYKFRVNYGFSLLLLLLTDIWVCDTAAYFFGIKFGKHKLAPQISPKKSIEGFLAGFIFAFIYAFFFHLFFNKFYSFSLFQIFIIPLIVGIFGQIGDLFESLIKRSADIKDSGKILPGHGGILDRFDSLIFSLPLIYIIFSYF
ncbi:MAG TPA: phosphatidate cytidylyltransferase [bacterium]|nr:phosphatidate cytidylyltransferase [bacterium]HOL46884.1 phosphatidate cytidylyltransferase [bacterium]HPQ18767.1 phosphatidate cytidylyltransferase [bacterium]